jgi:hypothetical protein
MRRGPGAIERQAALDHREGLALGRLWAREFATGQELEDVTTNALAERWVDGPAESLADTRWWIDLAAAYLGAMRSTQEFLARPEGRPRPLWAYSFVEGFVAGAAEVLADTQPQAA